MCDDVEDIEKWLTGEIEEPRRLDIHPWDMPALDTYHKLRDEAYLELLNKGFL